MNKNKIIKGLILLIILMVAVVFICGRIPFRGKASVDTAKELNQNTESARAKNTTSAENSVKSSKNSVRSSGSSETKVKKSVNISEGVLIKKYPGNYACFKFETPDGIKVITDPFAMDETVEADIVTESHQHLDHTDVSHLLGSYKAIYTIGDFSVKGINVMGLSGKHNKGVADGTNFIYVFDINGIKIAHFASQGELPNDKTLKKIGKVDILLIQASIRPEYANSKLNIKECKAIIEKLNPKIVIPEHGTPGLGKSLAKYLGVKLEYPKDSELVVTRNGLDAIKSLEVNDLDSGALY